MTGRFDMVLALDFSAIQKSICRGIFGCSPLFVITLRESLDFPGKHNYYLRARSIWSSKHMEISMFIWVKQTTTWWKSWTTLIDADTRNSFINHKKWTLLKLMYWALWAANLTIICLWTWEAELWKDVVLMLLIRGKTLLAFFLDSMCWTVVLGWGLAFALFHRAGPSSQAILKMLWKSQYSAEILVPDGDLDSFG